MSSAFKITVMFALFTGALYVFIGDSGDASRASTQDAPHDGAPLADDRDLGAESAAKAALNHKADRAAIAFDDAPRKLTASETERLTRWMHDHGYVYTIHDSGSSGARAFTGYDATDDQTLALLADRGDARAAMTLGERLLDDSARQAPLTPEQAAGAERLLEQASMLGYTASIDRLVELKLAQAVDRQKQSEPSRPRLDADLLLKAHAYSLLLERRGDINARQTRNTVESVGPLTVAQMKVARAMADSLYEQMSHDRALLGLPSFIDRLPPDIAAIGSRFAALHGGVER